MITEAKKKPDLARDIQLILNSAERLKRGLNTKVFDGLNKVFFRNEAKLHFKLTVRFMGNMMMGRYWK
jgi:hypothetical protein